MQVGNGNFAFGADVTGLQSVLPHNTLSSWGWHNSSLPTKPNQTSITDFTGLDWLTHGRLVNYDQPNPAEAVISQWLIANPHRANLARIGLIMANGTELVESNLQNKTQDLDMYTGILYSSFGLQGANVSVQTIVDSDSDTLAVQVQSSLFTDGKLAVFFDYPYASDKNKFDAPFVGLFNATKNHTTTLSSSGNSSAQIRHDMDATTYFTTIAWDDSAKISGPLNRSHRYILQPVQEETISFTASFTPDGQSSPTTFSSVQASSTTWWSDYWNTGAFIDLTSTPNASAIELQRRIVTSQYLLAVNCAGNDPPQESGLTNNGWYGQFHMEEVMWHLAHWARWDRWSLLARSVPGVYSWFLPTSIERAIVQQGYAGARLGKQSDPTGRSHPGEINSLLIWQQPHPFHFAELEYRSFPTNSTLQKWNDILVACAEFMASYAYYNTTTNVYDLGPPMYPSSENTAPNITTNPTFELAYWRFGLDIASTWQTRQSLPIPPAWTRVLENLAPLPTDPATDSYVIYEGIPDMWTNTTFDEDHPSMLAIYGFLPPPPTPDFNLTTMTNTVQQVYNTWNFTYSFGWDFPLAAMTAARLNDPQKAVDFLLHPDFQFDDVGMPVGGDRVPTPYFPASGSLLLAVAMMAGGWDGSPGPHWPEGWNVEVEGFAVGL